MAVPSGTASMQDIQDEFGGSHPISLSEYYSANGNIPASGTISINDFRGESALDPVPDAFDFTNISEPFGSSQHNSNTNTVVTSGHTGFNMTVTFTRNDPPGSGTSITIYINGSSTIVISGSTFAIPADASVYFNVNTVAFSGTGTSTGTVSLFNASDSSTLLDTFNWSHEMDAET